MLEKSLAAGVVMLRGDYEDDVTIKLLAKSAQNLGIFDITDSTLKAKHFKTLAFSENQEKVNKIVKDFVSGSFYWWQKGRTVRLLMC